MAGLEKIYIDEFKRFIKSGVVNRFNLRPEHRNLNFGSWKEPKGSQNIPVMCNALFADSISWEWFERYLHRNLTKCFLDYEGPISRMKTPWIVASLAYAYDKMPSKLQKMTEEFLETLFVFASLMTVNYSWVNVRKGQSIMCSGPRSPASESKDHALNDMISLVIDPGITNNFRGQGKFWSSELFKICGLPGAKCDELVSDIVFAPGIVDTQRIRKYLNNIKVLPEVTYVIMRFPGIMFTAFSYNHNKYGQPIILCLARQGMSGLKWETWPSGDTFRYPNIPKGGSLEVDYEREHGTLITLKYDLLERTVSLPPPDRLTYSYIANKDGYIFTKRSLTP